MCLLSAAPRRFSHFLRSRRSNTLLMNLTYFLELPRSFTLLSAPKSAKSHSPIMSPYHIPASPASRPLQPRVPGPGYSQSGGSVRQVARHSDQLSVTAVHHSPLTGALRRTAVQHVRLQRQPDEKHETLRPPLATGRHGAPSSGDASESDGDHMPWETSRGQSVGTCDVLPRHLRSPR